MSYKDTGKRVYENHQLVSTESTQVFMSEAGEITIITKENSDGFSQKYTVRTKDDGAIMIGATKAGAIGAWQASSLPNDPSQFATIQQTPANK